eukprot:m.352832 g.352832  ORF g.352832 m.352832 type:complete len:395 (+) comp16584_c1_seq2:170-1354(+)
MLPAGVTCLVDTGGGGGGGGEVFEIPSSGVGMLMGKGGETIKQLSSEFNVKITVPPPDQQRGEMTKVTISPNGPAANLDGVFEAMNAAFDGTVVHVGSAGAAAGGRGGGFGGGGGGGFGGGGGGAAAGGYSTDIWLFRVNPESLQIEVLLECYTKKWGPIREHLPPGNVDAVLDVLTNRCSGGQGIPFQDCEPAGNPVKLTKSKRQIYHLCCPQWTQEADAWNSWVPAPTRGCEGFTSVADLPWPAENFHSWVPLSELMSLPDGDVNKIQSLKTWGAKNFVSVASQVIEIYKSKGIEGQIADDAALIDRWNAAAAPGSPDVGGGGGGDWTQTNDGMALVANLWEMVQLMHNFDEATFTAAIGACFPGDDGVAALVQASNVFSASSHGPLPTARF